LLPLPVRRGRRARGNALRDDGRVRSARRHRGCDAGGRSAEASGRRRRIPRGTSAAARGADDAVARVARAARPGVHRLRSAAMKRVTRRTRARWLPAAMALAALLLLLLPATLEGALAAQ